MFSGIRFFQKIKLKIFITDFSMPHTIETSGSTLDFNLSTFCQFFKLKNLE